MLPERCGALSSREEQRKVGLILLLLLTFLYLLLDNLFGFLSAERPRLSFYTFSFFFCGVFRDADVLRSVTRVNQLKDLG